MELNSALLNQLIDAISARDTKFSAKSVFEWREDVTDWDRGGGKLEVFTFCEALTRALTASIAACDEGVWGGRDVTKVMDRPSDSGLQLTFVYAFNLPSDHGREQSQLVFTRAIWFILINFVQRGSA